MSKTNEELKSLKQECESFNTKVQELSDDELGYVVGGSSHYELFIQLGIAAFLLPGVLPVASTTMDATPNIQITQGSNQSGKDFRVV